MKSVFTLLFCICTAFIFAQPGHASVALDSGVSFELAHYRQSIISSMSK